MDPPPPDDATASQTDVAIDRLRAQTESYQNDREFLRRWGGLSRRDVELRAAQERAFVDRLAPVWESLEQLSILDVGCGSGRWLRWYIELGADPARIEGVDVSDVRFAEGRAKNAAVSMQVIDGLHLPFVDASFDLVTQWVCFMCIPTEAWRHAMAAEMLRVLKPGGYVFWWDTEFANASFTDGRRLDPQAFFPTLACDRTMVRAHGLPSSAVSRRHAGWVGALLDRLAASPTHVAARLGPKR